MENQQATAQALAEIKDLLDRQGKQTSDLVESVKRLEQREHNAYALANKSLEQVDKLTNIVMFLEKKIEKLEAKAAAVEDAYQRYPVR